jgi:hypothetical protein
MECEMEKMSFLLISDSYLGQKILQTYFERIAPQIQIQQANEPYSVLQLLYPRIQKGLLGIAFDYSCDRVAIKRTLDIIHKDKTLHSIPRLVLVRPEEFSTASIELSGLAECLVVNEKGVTRYFSLAQWIEILWFTTVDPNNQRA